MNIKWIIIMQDHSAICVLSAAGNVVHDMSEQKIWMFSESRNVSSWISLTRRVTGKLVHTFGDLMTGQSQDY